MKRALTDALIKTIAAPSAGRMEISDARCGGLAFRMTAAGAKSWCFRFRDPANGRDARLTIGPYPDISLSAARAKADDLRRTVAQGANPIELKRRERLEGPSRTFDILAARYLSEHARRHKRSASADKRNLNLHILPKWKGRRYDGVERRDVIELVEGLINAGKPTLANRVQALVSSIYSFAIDADLVKANPAARLRKRGAETVGRRVLTDEEIRLFWSRIVFRPVSRRVGLALRLALLTGTRAGEVAGITRSEIEHLHDHTKAGWIIPASRSKNGRAHFVPLTPLAQEVVRAARELLDEEECLFSSPSKAGKPITAHALAVAMSRFAKKLEGDSGVVRTWQTEPPTPHDLRRTLATRLSALGIPKEDRDAVLNHTRGDVGSKHYDLYDRAAEKRRALLQWDAALSLILHDRAALVAIGASRKAGQGS